MIHIKIDRESSVSVMCDTASEATSVIASLLKAGHITGNFIQSADASEPTGTGITAFVRSLHPDSRDLLIALTEFPKGVDREEFGNELGITNPAVLHGKFTAISKRAAQAGLNYSALVQTDLKKKSGVIVAWVKPTKLLMQFREHLVAANQNASA